MRPQPGTIPYRAVAWLRAQASIYPTRWYSTNELCLGLEVEVEGFTAYMRPSREQGLVRTKTKADHGKLLFWRIGDGTPDFEPERDDQLLRDSLPLNLAAVSASPFVQPRGFRALEWDGHLLATGMEIRDGVAIFTPEQVLELKRRTDWWRVENSPPA